MSPARVVVAGLGDSGLLTAIHLARHRRVATVVGVSAKPGLVSGQELGRRLAHPEEWARDYRVPFDRYRLLDDVRTVHGALTGLDLDRRRVEVRGVDGRETHERFDVLVIATGVSNGFWRRPALESPDDVAAGLRAPHERLRAADSVAVIGGGAAAVSSAANLATRWPEKAVHLYFPGDRALPAHHGRAWSRVRERLLRLGVVLHPGHRAVVPHGFDCDAITDDPVAWSTGQPEARADAVLWAIGRVRPNTDWLPTEVLDDDGFVRVGPHLEVPDHPGLFAIGDVAASDPLRSSARNRADRLLARNVRASLAGRALREYRWSRRRWGSVLGPQDDGLEIFTPSGSVVRFPAWSVRHVVQPWFVRRGIYGGVRRPSAEQ